jgi:hypothetical protein
MTTATLTEEVLANLIASVIIGLVGALIVFGFAVFYRAKLLQFFGLEDRARVFQCYLSRLIIEPGMLRKGPDILHGYAGPAINRNEYRGACELAELFRPGVLGILPARLRELLCGKFLSLSPVDVRIDTSPPSTGEIRGDNCYLFLGTGAHSAASRAIFEHPLSFFDWTKDDDENRAFRFRDQSRMLIGFGRSRDPLKNVEQGVIQRLRINFPDPNSSPSTVIVCSGLGSSATMNSARYLASNWAALFREFGGDDFGIVLGFRQPAPDTENLADPTDVLKVRRDGGGMKPAG